MELSWNITWWNPGETMVEPSWNLPRTTPSKKFVEPWWNPRPEHDGLVEPCCLKKLLEPWWNPRGTLPQTTQTTPQPGTLVEPSLVKPSSNPQPSKKLVEPWWNPRGTLPQTTPDHPALAEPGGTMVEPCWNPGGTMVELLVEPSPDHTLEEIGGTLVEPSSGARRAGGTLLETWWNEPYLKPPRTTLQPSQNLVKPWLVEFSWNQTRPPQPLKKLLEPWRNPRETFLKPAALEEIGGTLVEPWWNLTSNHPRPPRPCRTWWNPGTLVEPWWNYGGTPGGTLVEPWWWNPGGTLAQGRPEARGARFSTGLLQQELGIPEGGLLWNGHGALLARGFALAFLWLPVKNVTKPWHADKSELTCGRACHYPAASTHREFLVDVRFNTPKTEGCTVHPQRSNSNTHTEPKKVCQQEIPVPTKGWVFGVSWQSNQPWKWESLWPVKTVSNCGGASTPQ